MEERARHGEGNRDRAVEQLSLSGRGESSKAIGERKILSFFHSPLARFHFGCIPVLPISHGLDSIHYITATHIHNSISLHSFFQRVLFSLSPVLCLLLWFRLRLCLYVISPLRYLDEADTPPSRPSGQISPH